MRSVMRVLIVEGVADLGWLWKRHLDRQGCLTDLVSGQEAAVQALRETEYDVIVLDLMIPEGSAFAVSDFASYRQPEARVIFVSRSAFFSDGSIFNHSPNARAMIPSDSPPSDLVALVEHYGMVG